MPGSHQSPHFFRCRCPSSGIQVQMPSWLCRSRTCQVKMPMRSLQIGVVCQFVDVYSHGRKNVIFLANKKRCCGNFLEVTLARCRIRRYSPRLWGPPFIYIYILYTCMYKLLDAKRLQLSHQPVIAGHQCAFALLLAAQG